MPTRFNPARFKLAAVAALTLLAAGGLAASYQLPEWGAKLLLYPFRRPILRSAPPACRESDFQGAGPTLRGWRCAAVGEKKGTIVYLHGNGDNRTSAMGVVERFVPKGFDVVAYDSRAQGQSDGSMSTYGYFEKEDLRLVINTLEPGPVVLFGVSLGAAVALQEAATDSRVSAIIAVEPFSDLRTIATHRAPFVFTDRIIERAFELAEQRAGFDVDAVSPVAAAASIRVPVLLIHGAGDDDTPPEHSQRIYEALRGPKHLLLVFGAGHNQSLRQSWDEVSAWLASVLPSPTS